MWMGLILGSLFFGVSVLAHHLRPYPSEHSTVIAQLGLRVFGSGPIFVTLQIATAAILTLAANTAYADFPRLSSIVARDGYLPRQFANRGDRLVFSNGIVFLATAAGVLVVAFGGVTNALIPLYAVGVFTAFTLSQAGMVRHHLAQRESGWRRNIVINAVGAAATFVVLVIVAATKFTSGAWLPLVVIPLVVALFRGINRHYTRVEAALQVPDDYRPPRMNHTVLVLVGRVHRGVLDALTYARTMNPDRLFAVTVATDESDQDRLEKEWLRRDIREPLEILYSPYRELTRPILRYIGELEARWNHDIVAVVIPEFIVRRWWEHLLHNQSALILKGRLLFRKNTVVTSVPYQLD